MPIRLLVSAELEDPRAKLRAKRAVLAAVERHQHAHSAKAPGKRTLVETAAAKQPESPAPASIAEMRAATLELERAVAARELQPALDAAAHVRQFLEAAPGVAGIAELAPRARAAYDAAPRLGADVIAEARAGNWRRWDEVVAAWTGKPMTPVDIAAGALATPPQPLPHLATIQRSFGRFDLGSVQAHVGGPVADISERLGARAFTLGEAVAFAAAPDLHTAAHEAAHVVQQRRGVALAGGIDSGSDAFEHQADRIADAVVRGETVEHLLAVALSSGGGGQVVQRKEATASTRPATGELAADKSFEIESGKASARVRRDWLRHHSYAHYLELFRAMRDGGAIAWATDADLARLAGRTPPLAADGDAVVHYELGVRSLAVIGLPSNEPIVEHTDDGFLVAVRVDGLPAEPDGYVELATAQLDVVYAALAKVTGKHVVKRVLLGAMVQRPGTALLRVGARELAEIFPEGQTTAASHEPTTVPAAHASSELSRAETARLEQWTSTLGRPAPSHPTRELIELIAEIEADPVLADRVRALMQSVHRRTVDTMLLRDLIDRARVEMERARLKLDAPVENADGAEARSHADLPARLVERALVFDRRPVTFELAIDWSRAWFATGSVTDLAASKFRAIVEWAFERIDAAAPDIATEREEYQSSKIERPHTFRLADHERSGRWVVHAFLHTTGFAPKHITTTVEVKSERARLEELRGEAFAGVTPDAPTVEDHEFDIGRASGILKATRDAAAGIARLFVDAPASRDSDVEGTRTTGWQPKDFAARTAAERASIRAKEIEQTQKLIAYLEGQHRGDNETAIAVAKRRLEHLIATNHDIDNDDKAGWRPFELRGTYLSRIEIPSGPLDLYGSVRRYTDRLTPARVEVQIRDNSQRFAAENYTFHGRAQTFEGALESAYVDLCKSYPEGVVSIMAQELVVDRFGTRPDGRVIGFELATTAPWKRLKAKVFAPLTSIAVNLAAAALMAFQPELAPLILPMVAATNAAPSVDDLIARQANGTLSLKQASIDLADIGLNVLPLAHGALPLRAGTGLFAVEVATHAGQLLVMTAQAKEAIEQIQESDLAALAEQYRGVLELEKSTNPSDPALAEKRAAVDRAAADIRKKTRDEWNKAVANNAVFMFASHVGVTALHGAHEATEHLTEERAMREYERAIAPTSGATQAREEVSGGSYVVTASAVQGSSFTGRGAKANASVLLENAHTAIVEVVAQDRRIAANHRAHVDAAARPDERVIAQHTHVIELADKSAISIRISVAPLEHQTVARTIMNPTKHGMTKIAPDTTVDVDGRYVIQLSEGMDPAHARRAIAHEVAQILAHRELALQNRVPPADTLRSGAASHAELSPHDHGRIAEINEIVRANAADLDHELTALIDELGLRKGMLGAEERVAKIAGELSEAAKARLEVLREHESRPGAHAEHVSRVREQAAKDRAAQAEYDRTHAPTHETPTTGLGRIATEAERTALAAHAEQNRARKSAETVASIRALNARGEVPKMRTQCGGGAALAARDPGALLVDGRQRWAIDSSDHIAQTAHQLERLREAGIGDPYEFAHPNERVPIEALRYWQDTIAAQGPVINGWGTFDVHEGKLILKISPTEGGPELLVEVDGAPLVASGFTKEVAPGGTWGGPSPRRALIAIDTALAKLQQDAVLGKQAKAARSALAAFDGVKAEDSARALEVLSPELIAELRKDQAAAISTLEAERAFERLRADDPEHVLYADEANVLSEDRIKRMKRVVIGGTGGTGVSAAEVILRLNPAAHVVMVGKDAPQGLFENGQFRELVARHGTKELCERFHIKPEGIDGRFELRDGYLVNGPIKTEHGTYDVNAKPAQGNGNAPAFEGDTYVAGLGRYNDLPAPVASLANAAERAGRSVEVVPVFDGNFYVGYTVMIHQADGSVIKVDVTGAASRFVDTSMLTPKQREAMKAAEDQDAPPEGGNFPGGYGPSALQSKRYATRKRSNLKDDGRSK